MKALRILFLFLLAAFSFAASAQTIEIYKDGRVIDSFSAAQVDSVVYASAAAQPRYYYYAGWDCPTSVEDLESRGTEIENFGNMKTGDVIVLFDGSIIHPENKYAQYFLLIPNGVSIYDGEGQTRSEYLFTEQSTSFVGYKEYLFNKNVKRITGIMLKK